MLKMRYLVLFLLVSLIFLSCDKVNKTATTAVSFMRGDRAGSSEIIVSGRSDDSVPASYFTMEIPSGSESLSLELPNGSWEFSAIGWTNEDMSGNLFCSQSVPLKSLTGISTSIPIFLEQSSCWQVPFNLPEMQNELTDPDSVLPLRVVTCDKLESSLKKKAAYYNMKKEGRSQYLWTYFPALDDYCSANSNGGPIQSFKVILPLVPLSGQTNIFSQVDSWNQTFPSSLESTFTSECFEIPNPAKEDTKAGTYYRDTNLQLPLGPQGSLENLMFRSVVMAYSASNCEGTYEVFSLVDDGGLTGKEVIFDVESDNSRVVAYLFDQALIHKFLRALSHLPSTSLCYTSTLQIVFSREIDTTSVIIEESAGSPLTTTWSNSNHTLSFAPSGLNHWNTLDDYANTANTVSISGNTASSAGGEEFTLSLDYLTCPHVSSPELYLTPSSIDETYIVAEAANISIDVNDVNTGNDTDADGEGLIYTCSVTGSIKERTDCNIDGMSFSTPAGIFSWTPTYDQAGTYMLVIRGTDNGEFSDTLIFSIEVTNTNRPPQLSFASGSASNEIEENQTLTINLQDTNTSSDVDGDSETISYTCTGCDSIDGLSFDATAGSVLWTPDYTQGHEFGDTDNQLFKVYNFQITGTDIHAASDTIAISVQVNNVNRLPDITCSPSSQEVVELLPITDVNCNDTAGSNDDLDADNETLTYSCISGDCAKVNLPSSSSGEFNWHTTNTASSEIASSPYSFTIQAEDVLGGTDTTTFSIDVISANASPNLSYTGTTFLTAGSGSFTINVGDGGNDSDADGQAITYSCSGCSAVGASFNTSTGVITWTPTTSHNNIYNFTVTGDDNQGASNSTSSIVVALDVNNPPTISCPSGIIYVTMGSSYNATCTYSDPNNDVLTVRYIADGCSGAEYANVFSFSSSQSSATVSFNAVSPIANGYMCSCTIYVKDAHNEEVSGGFTLITQF